MLTNTELTAQVKRLSLRTFERPFVHEVRWNTRLRTTGGRFFPADGHLDFNPKFSGHPDFEKIVLHELCHYHLYFAHAGYRHSDPDFKHLLKQVGGSRHAPALATEATRHFHYSYCCVACGQLFARVRQIDTRKYRCGKCRGKLQLIEKAS